MDYTDFERGLSKAQVQAIKDTGVVIVKGGVSQEVSLDIYWTGQPAIHISRHLGSSWLEAVHPRVRPREHRSRQRYAASQARCNYVMHNVS